MFQIGIHSENTMTATTIRVASDPHGYVIEVTCANPAGVAMGFG